MSATKKRPTIEIPAPGEWYTPEMKRWLCGYEPVAAAEHIGKLSAYKKGLISRKAREAAAAANIGWGAGTIEGMGKNTKPHNTSPIQRIKIAQGIGTFPTKAAKSGGQAAT